MTGRRMRVDRRASLRRVARFVTGEAAAGRAQDGRPEIRLAPVEEIVAAPELEQMAELVLSPQTFAAVRSGARGAFDRTTFRQRLMVYAMELDLTTELFGYSMFAPIIVGPVGNQRRLHEEGELATARGASAARTIMVATRQASVPVEEIRAATEQPLWYQVYADDPAGPVGDDVAAAVAAGCPVVCVTVGVSSTGSAVTTDWPAVGRLAAAVDVPVVVKGIMSADDAETALGHGARGLVVSNHGGVTGLGGVLPIEVLQTVADAVGDRAPVLVDGGFQRGSDILKGLALGATAVMLSRPMMWGLAAYGASGVETALRLLINELARNMAASGRPTIEMIDSSLVRWDSR